MRHTLVRSCTAHAHGPGEKTVKRMVQISDLKAFTFWLGAAEGEGVINKYMNEISQIRC